MEAKDTVIKYNPYPYGKSGVRGAAYEEGKKAQAKISFKAGYNEGIKALRLIGTITKHSPTAEASYRAGIREVVDRIDKHFTEYEWMGNEDWKQAKLKEWGL